MSLLDQWFKAVFALWISIFIILGTMKIFPTLNTTRLVSTGTIQLFNMVEAVMILDKNLKSMR